MEIKLFGKSLFELKKDGGILFSTGNSALKKSKFLPDFYAFFNSSSVLSGELYTVITDSNGNAVAVSDTARAAKKELPKEEIKITPKGVYQLKTLNVGDYHLKTDPKYVDEQLQSFKDKLALIKTAEYDMTRGVQEIASIISRLENRKKYQEFQKFYDEFPYTTTPKISEVTSKHSHLRLGLVDQFLADMPKEATDAMKEYTKQTEKLCALKPMFYIIANKKDFEKSQKRRDPILLAQSPFAHVWQILGAWDEEMLLLDEL